MEIQLNGWRHTEAILKSLVHGGADWRIPPRVSAAFIVSKMAAALAIPSARFTMVVSSATGSAGAPSVLVVQFTNRGITRRESVFEESA